MSSIEPTTAYLEAEAKRITQSYQLFELMVKDCWYGVLASCLREFGPFGGPEYAYRDKPRFDDEYGRHFLGGGEFLDPALKYASRALGGKIDANRFKELVETVLQEELEKHEAVLVWTTQENWDGVDRVLEIYHKSEAIPEPT